MMKKFWNRNELKSFFGKGKLPTQVHFEYLIDSSINKLEDGFNRTDADGLQLSPTGQSQHVISFLKDAAAEHPTWQISLQNDEAGTGLSFGSVEEDAEGKVKTVSRLFLSETGRIGINITEPLSTLDVNGTLASKTRVGRIVDQIPGDGNWHQIMPGLNEPKAFEVMARIDGPQKRGRYAMTHALVLLPYGNSRYRIKQTRAHFGWFMNRIELRCTGKAKDFALEMRTRSNYGKDAQDMSHKIRFHITELWDDQLFNSF